MSESSNKNGTASAEVAADVLLDHGRDVLAKEGEAIARAGALLDKSFADAVRLILNMKGRVAVTGMGKAGLVGRKIQATLASTATPAYSIHPGEAIHGDLGMIAADDVVLCLTNSGETQELVKLLPILRRMGCAIILLTSRVDSTCGQASDVVIDIGDAPEACPLGLAPSSSTTAMLAVGDALALTVMRIKEVRPEQYAAFHPGGALGRSLMRVREIMRTELDCPSLLPDDTVGRYYEVLEKAPRRAGAAAVIDAAGKLVGFFTHGDFVRCFHHDSSPLEVRLETVMTKGPKYALESDLVADALVTMRGYRIDELPVVDDDHKLVGMIDIQDLVACGYSAFDDQ